MTYYSPQLIQTMRDALDTVMSRVPMDHAIPGLKAHLPEFVLHAAAQGLTNYDGRRRARSKQLSRDSPNGRLNVAPEILWRGRC